MSFRGLHVVEIPGRFVTSRGIFVAWFLPYFFFLLLIVYCCPLCSPHTFVSLSLRPEIEDCLDERQPFWYREVRNSHRVPFRIRKVHSFRFYVWILVISLNFIVPKIRVEISAFTPHLTLFLQSEIHIVWSAWEWESRHEWNEDGSQSISRHYRNPLPLIDIMIKTESVSNGSRVWPDATRRCWWGWGRAGVDIDHYLFSFPRFRILFYHTTRGKL